MGKKDEGTLEALAAVIASRIDSAKPVKRRFRVITTPEPTLFDSITRDSCLKRIRFLGRAYGLAWLIDQATFDIPSLDCLEDEQLAALLRDMERGRECVTEGVSFDEAGLVRDTGSRLPTSGS